MRKILEQSTINYGWKTAAIMFPCLVLSIGCARKGNIDGVNEPGPAAAKKIGTESGSPSAGPGEEAGKPGEKPGEGAAINDCTWTDSLTGSFLRSGEDERVVLCIKNLSGKSNPPEEEEYNLIEYPMKAEIKVETSSEVALSADIDEWIDHWINSWKWKTDWSLVEVIPECYGSKDAVVLRRVDGGEAAGDPIEEIRVVAFQEMSLVTLWWGPEENFPHSNEFCSK